MSWSARRRRGERITIEGRVFDGTGTPVRDVLLEIWQANADGPLQPPGRHAQPSRSTRTSAAGAAPAPTSRPASTPSRPSSPGRVDRRRGGKPMAPHINFWIVARGINIGLSTRMYFSDEAAANAADPGAQPDRAGEPAADADRRAEQQRRQGRLHVRHPPAGRERDRVLRRLRNGRPMRAELVRKYAAPVPRYTSYGAALSPRIGDVQASAPRRSVAFRRATYRTPPPSPHRLNARCCCLRSSAASRSSGTAGARTASTRASLRLRPRGCRPPDLALERERNAGEEDEQRRGRDVGADRRHVVPVGEAHRDSRRSGAACRQGRRSAAGRTSG